MQAALAGRASKRRAGAVDGRRLKRGHLEPRYLGGTRRIIRIMPNTPGRSGSWAWPACLPLMAQMSHRQAADAIIRRPYGSTQCGWAMKRKCTPSPASAAVARLMVFYPPSALKKPHKHKALTSHRPQPQLGHL